VKYYGFTSYLSLIHKRRPDHDAVCKTFQHPIIKTNNETYDNSFFNKLIGILVYCKTSSFLTRAMGMDDEKWKTYTKFCFIRNPYERTYSGWKHVTAVLYKSVPFYDYISQIKYYVSDIEYGHVFMPQKTHIQDVDGNCGVDIIGRFETLEQDFQNILLQIGFPTILHREKKVNVSSKKNNPHHNNTSKFDVKTIRQLNVICKEDLETFHYKKCLL
jgi:hypothetical protein